VLLLSGLVWLVSSPVQSVPDATVPTGQSVSGFALPLAENVSDSDNPDKMYIVKESDGFIAVFDEDDGELLFTTETRADTLRLSDQDKLSSGITVYGYKNLVALLEDFQP
jgi:hypothetical protein